MGVDFGGGVDERRKSEPLCEGEGEIDAIVTLGNGTTFVFKVSSSNNNNDKKQQEQRQQQNAKTIASKATMPQKLNKSIYSGSSNNHDNKSSSSSTIPTTQCKSFVPRYLRAPNTGA